MLMIMDNDVWMQLVVLLIIFYMYPLFDDNFFKGGDLELLHDNQQNYQNTRATVPLEVN